MISENYWYYTLSSIPQTLAAMIALAATFVVFKLSWIQDKIETTRKDLRRFILLVTAGLDHAKYPTEIHEIEPLSNTEFLDLYKLGLKNLDRKSVTLGLNHEMYNKYESEMMRIINQEWNSHYTVKDFRIYGFLEMKKVSLESLLATRTKSLRLLEISLSLVTLTILVSLVVLPHYLFYGGSRVLVDIILGLALISVAFTGYSVWAIAKAE